MKRVLLWGVLALVGLPTTAAAEAQLSLSKAKTEVRQRYERLDYFRRCERISARHVYCRAVNLAGELGQKPDRYCFTFDIWPRRVGLHACVLRDCPYASAQLNPKRLPSNCDA